MIKKKCGFCEKIKAVSYFGKDKPYCLTCYRLYFKHFKQGGHACHSEREILMDNFFFHKKENLDATYNLIYYHPHAFKRFRALLRDFPESRVEMEKLLRVYE